MWEVTKNNYCHQYKPFEYNPKVLLMIKHFKIWNSYGQLGEWEVTKNNYYQYKVFEYDPKILVINTKL